MTDEQTGVEPVDDDLARLRAQRGGSVADRAQNGEGEEIVEADDGQMFVWEQGRKVTLGTLIARGTPIEYAFVFGQKRLKGRGELIALDDDVLLVSRGLVGKTSLVPKRDDMEKVEKVTIETHVASKVVVPADSDESMSLLAGVLERRGYSKQGEAA